MYDKHGDLDSFPTRRSSDLEHGSSSWRQEALGKLGDDGVVGIDDVRDPDHAGLGRDRRRSQLHRRRQDSQALDRKSTRLNSSHGYISYAVLCLKKKSNLSST